MFLWIGIQILAIFCIALLIGFSFWKICHSWCRHEWIQIDSFKRLDSETNCTTGYAVVYKCLHCGKLKIEKIDVNN